MPGFQPDARLRERQAGAHAQLICTWRVEGPRSRANRSFVAGHPGSTNRLLTVAQLKFQRDVSVPSYLIRNSELRGRLIQWGKTGEEPLRIIQDTLLGVENSLKVYRGFQLRCSTTRLFDAQDKAGTGVARASGRDAKLAAQVGTAWDDIATAQDRYRQIYDRYLYLESGAGFNSELFAYARQLVRGAAERAKPNELRLREYAESNLPKICAGLLATTPVLSRLRAS